MSEQRAQYNVTYKTKPALNRAIRNEIRRLESTDSTDYKGPDPSLVRALIEHANWRRSEVSRLLRVDVSTVRRWTASSEQAQSREMPFCAWFVLLQASGYCSIESLIAA